jgi:hypothetical protein
MGAGNVEFDYGPVDIMEAPTEMEQMLWRYLMQFYEISKAYARAKTDEEKEQAGSKMLFE